jgi:hypothetical protein
MGIEAGIPLMHLPVDLLCSELPGLLDHCSIDVSPTLNHSGDWSITVQSMEFSVGHMDTTHEHTRMLPRYGSTEVSECSTLALCSDDDVRVLEEQHQGTEWQLLITIWMDSALELLHSLWSTASFAFTQPCDPLATDWPYLLVVL